jgi:hypothetical protein
MVFLSSIGAEKRRGAGFIDGLARIEQRLDAAREQGRYRAAAPALRLLHDELAHRAGRAAGRAADHYAAAGQPDAEGRSARHRHRGHAAPARRRLDGRQVQAVHGPADLTWTEAAAALSTATAVSSKAEQITDDEQRAAGMGEVAVEGIVGMGIGKCEGFTPEQPRSVLTTTPGSLASWAITHLWPAL